MISRPLLVSLTLLLVAAPAVVTAAAAVSLPGIPEIAYKRYVLGNGLTLIVHEDHKAPIVAVNVWYHVGSKNEKPGKTGFAHLFEHLMFNGSEHFNDDYFKVLQKIGATDMNGTTNSDRTNYFQNVPVGALDTVLWMESDRMGHLLGAIDQARLDEQRGVVQNEKRQGENQPYGRARELLTENAYPAGHPYSWTTIGSMEDLNAASLDDVREWFRTYYGPSNAVLVVAGDVAPQDVEARVQKYFGDIPPGPPIAHQDEWVAKRTGEHRETLQDRVPQARIYKEWNTAPYGSYDDGQLDLAAAVLSSGKTSRLWKRLVYDDQLATDVAAYQASAEIGSRFVIQATARPGVELSRVEKALDEELARFVADGPTADEVERAKTQNLARFVRGIERIGGFGGSSDVLAENQVYFGNPDYYRTRLERVRDATPATVGEVAKRWLSDGLYVLEVHPFADLKAAKQGAERTKPPEPAPAAAGRLPAFSRTRLGNGLEVIVAERHALPLVTVRLLIDAGYASDAQGVPGLARLAADMMDEGTTTRSALEISDALQRLGARLDTSSDLDTTVVSLSALKANLGPSLELMADVVVNPSFPEADFQRLRRQQIAAIDQESVSPNSMALRVLPRLIYGEGHPYANPLTGSGFKTTVEKLTRDDAVRWHHTWVRPAGATLIVIGDTTGADIVPLLEKAFAGWKGGAAPKKDVGPAASGTAPAIYVLDRPGALQSVVFAGEVVPPRANPQEIAQKVMNQVLGGQFISRLNMNLREDKHWSYGARTILLDARGPRPFLAIAPVQTDKTKESVAEMLKELRGVTGDKPVTADELATAEDSLVLTLPGRWETADAVADSIGDIVRFGFPDDYFEGYAAKVRAVSLADVAQAAKIIRPDRLVWVVAGDREKIEPGLATLGLGPVRPIDADGHIK
jgi:zinc protease